MILFENVSKKYRGTQRPALDNISFEITRGEFVFIVGASGSGKSSCLRLILREEQPTNGRIHVLGHDLGKISSRKVPYFRRNLGVVFQDFRLLTNKTVYDNVAFSLQVIGKSRGFIQEAVPDTLKMVGLEGKEKRYPHELSGGEQQRVAIARAIVNKPAVLLADEPTGNLDPATSLGIMQLLRAINAAGTTIVMATHEAAFVDIMQQRVIEISQGVIVRDEQRGGYGETASIPMIDLSQAGSRTMRTPDDLVRQTLAPGAPSEQASVGDGVEAPERVVPGMRTLSDADSLPSPPPAVTVAGLATVAGAATAAELSDPPVQNTPEAGALPAEPDGTAVPNQNSAEHVIAGEQLVDSEAKLRSSLPEFLQPVPDVSQLGDTAEVPTAPEQVASEISDVHTTLPGAAAHSTELPVAATPEAESVAPVAPAADPTLGDQGQNATAGVSASAEELDPVKLATEGGWAKRLGLTARDNDDQTDVGPVR